ncbi:NUDIX domain-containing protein [Ochrobactrum pecoris]|uniref:8-oxo-dGTP pyrophosphatase MutT (NUDIX family) n=1 Tax=Brucella pecoris TaxID=867683 RepID=A0A5C5CDN0_9HYPH|nr:NUDIX domain-containing protein [Brucella pecoris]MBB4094056.1 8-oxo-dGTP pyrophosphatase MutT (NUDIX family) [Brucella pecoris]NKW79869.1 NUDIX domain-containing protein [Brucella pecoris]TNV09430.1 NUDIX domain-containing protein [Brucella pecoris]
MTVTTLPIDKVLIYATWNDRLLVFEEPDFPETPLQVPGGTVDPGEDILAAAYREFAEETGLLYDEGMLHLETVDYNYPEQGQTESHRRHCFHLRLKSPTPETWDHHEMSPCDGSAPILFRLFWLDRSSARNQLGLGMAKSLNKINF